ncbi:ATP-binding protein [Azospirillum thermophilum]|uniref:ATP-binding protein n=1 Tax=Azospirillum thermophilum TaxID=2202148 RepID=A0A2S2CX86_9PROT|nr:ATP-binding protein [Azospirillum thermophilum]AWK89089.1 ATP-binding protein [Azospirillum thermophilum]
MSMSGEQGTLFDERFLGRYAGTIMSDPTTALVELVANAWDAYATTVEIQWPDRESGAHFQITDNGKGMTPEQFEVRWRTLDYDRISYQGAFEDPPADLPAALPRPVYGRNGKGRHAAFLFSSPYRVRTWRDGVEAIYLVSQGKQNPIEVLLESRRDGIQGHGTEINGVHLLPCSFTAGDVRALLSTRFLTNPEFAVFVDGVRVGFSDVPSDCLQELNVDVPGYGQVKVLVIDSQRADRTTKQHGIAWWVNRRLVGQCGWRMSDQEKVLDGRTEEAKRYTFIVHADLLAPAVQADWGDFRPEHPVWLQTQEAVQNAIRNVILGITKEKRAKAKETVRRSHRNIVKDLPGISRERWNRLLDQVVDQCPSMSATQIDQVMGLLANLELAESQYSLLEKLHALKPDELDQWDAILERWTISTAKVALDEIEKRLKLIEEIRAKSEIPGTDEVHEIQPLFGQALWIFGPQFESIEFTSNRGMTTVIKQLFGGNQRGSLNRPDFVVVPDGSVGFYSRPSFDTEFNENGIDVLVIVELKSPGVPVGSDEKGQVWKYIRELMKKGYVTDRTSVYGYVLGDRIDSIDGGERKEGDRIFIRPMLYNTFVGQGEKRMLNLHRRLLDAPFMQAAMAEFLAKPEVEAMPAQMSLLNVPAVQEGGEVPAPLPTGNSPDEAVMA